MEIDRNPKMLLIPLLVATSFIAISPRAKAQTPDPVAQSLDLTRAKGSVPAWEKPPERAVLELSEFVRSSSPGVYLVGDPEIGYGTAFVVSKEHRLLATNAHVADILDKSSSMLAIRNGSSEVYKVESALYHPGVRRRMNGGVVARSANPKDGPVDPNSPDVAILQLAPGPDIPFEFVLGTPAEVYDLFARPIGMLGFPAHDTVSWPGIGQKAEATFRQGVVARLSDFGGSVSIPKNELQFVQHSMASWFGFSGSPIFLPNGHVVILNNSAGKHTSQGMTTTLSYGIRIDCLWELLASHQLGDKIPIPVPIESLSLDRYSKPDPVAERLGGAIKMVEEAAVAFRRSNYALAIELCTKAIAMAPEYPESYNQRATSYQQYAEDRGAGAGTMPYFQQALEDQKTYVRLKPQNIDGLLTLCSIKASILYAADSPLQRTGVGTAYSDVTAIVTRLLEIDRLTPWQRAHAYQLRARTRTDSSNRLGDLNEAIRLQPFSPMLWGTRASYFENTPGYAANGASDRAYYNTLREAWNANEDAWPLATSKEPEKRDGKKALDFAARACTNTQYKHSKYIATLAAAYAEMGDFNSAGQWAAYALSLSPADEKATYQEHIKLYAAGKPLRP